MSNILIITPDTIGPKMSSPGIRAWEMARVLSLEHQVVLGTAMEPAAASRFFAVRKVNEQSLPQLCDNADILILQSISMVNFPLTKQTSKPLVIDLFNAFIFENLEANKHLSLQERLVGNQTDLLNTVEILQNGDFFLCSSDRQRDCWMGMLYFLNRINPAIYSQDPTGKRLIGVVPNGLHQSPPVSSSRALKGVLGNIQRSDRVLIWGGNLCNWFDPLTLIRAMAIVRQHREDIKLYFLGVKAPTNPMLLDHIWDEVPRAVELSKSLGLYNTFVYFGPEWTPNNDRQDYLLDADLGVTFHLNNLETHFSFRTRVLDYLWAGLPVITSEGDVMAALVKEHNLGRVVPCQDHEQAAAAILELLSEEAVYRECQNNIAVVRTRFYWENVMQPLMDYCRNPWKTKAVS